MCRLFTLVTLMLALSFASCQGNQKKAQNESTETAAKTVTVLTPDKVLADAASLVGQEIEIKGTVDHVCRHGGKKCKMSANGSTIKIMAGGEIKEFDKALIGTEIIVKGTVTENKITKEMIAEQETALKEAAAKAEKEEVKEHCSSSMQNVEAMKQWMTDNNKDYYPVYVISGTSFKKAN